MNTNLQNHLIDCLIEECSEVIKSCCKAKRFGLIDTNPTSEKTNAQEIARELVDIVAITEMLEECEAIHRLGTIQEIERKKTRVAFWMEHSKAMGQLQNDHK